MKTGRLFWGVFFLGLGVLVLGEKLSIIGVQWGIAWKLWPVVLLLWGAALLIGGNLARRIAAGAAALTLAYFLVALFSFSWCNDDWHSGPIAESQQTLVEPFDSSLHRAAFSLESGAGIFTVGDTTADLLAIRTESDMGGYVLSSSGQGEGKRYMLSMEGKKKWRFGRMTNRVDVRLNAGPAWDLDVDVGAAELQCDLTGLNIARLNVNAGASSMRVRLGDRYPETEVVINAGVSSIRLSVPESSGCEIRVDTKLTSKSFDGFTKYGKSTYRTDNFETAGQKILVDVDAGVSSIAIDRY